MTTLTIQECVSLRDKNWFQTGGNARFFCAPRTAQEFTQALHFAHLHQHDVYVLGEGANVLIHDDGFDGLVIIPALTNISVAHKDNGKVHVTAGAGVRMHDLIEHCLTHNILGLEEFSGIPGTVGGSVYINLHYFEFLISQFLVSARVIHRTTGDIMHVDTAWFNFGYNHSTLHAKEYYLVDATFELSPASEIHIAYAQGRRTEIIRHRMRRYPNSHTCGSFFRLFHENEVSLVVNGKKMIFVGYYLDKVGVKGNLRIGDALVSYQHANMIVNCGNASSNDIIQLARLMQERVYEEFGIIPQPECELIGFKQYPLHEPLNINNVRHDARSAQL